MDFLGVLPHGTHLCQFYHQKEDLLETLVPYFEAGLKNGERCIWIAPIPEKEALAFLSQQIDRFENYVKKGQFEAFCADEWYFKKELDPDLLPHLMIGQIERQVQETKKKGFSGLRTAGGVHKMQGKNWKPFLQYEKMVEETIAALGIVALCTYLLANCPLRNIPKVIDCHHKTIVKRGVAWEVVDGTSGII